MLTRSVANMDKLITDKLHLIRNIPFDVVVHIPRSGTIPASLVATYLCKPLASVEEFCRNIIETRKSDVRSTNRILLVDDSIRTGTQMQAHLSRIRQERPDAVIYTMAVYSTKVRRKIKPTIVLDEHEEGEYIYPWFMWKTKRISKCAVDMDGVLCRDCTREEDDDGENYLEFIQTADVKFQPLTHPIGAIVTSRLEKYREQTEHWLKNNGIKYGELVMGKWQSKEDRKGKQAAWKASVYKKMPYQLYIESSAKEAPEIARISGKSVWCIDEQRAYP